MVLMAYAGSHALAVFGLLAALLAVSPCAAQPGDAAGDSRAGTVAAVLGDLRVERASGEAALEVGDAVIVGDRLRTGGGDRAKLVLSDDSVIDIGSDSEVILKARRFDPQEGQEETVVRLNEGQMRAVAPPAAMRPGARFEVETPAAVVFRSGEFFVSYDALKETSRVVALSGVVGVAGRLGVVGGPVDLAPEVGTEVRKGHLPASPAKVSSEALARIRQSTAVVGTGRRDGLDVLHPATRGRLLASGDVPMTVRDQTASPLRLGPPQESLADRLSADVRTNTEPLLEYERRRPGAPAVSGVEVEF
jgi:hypothetical protein